MKAIGRALALVSACALASCTQLDAINPLQPNTPDTSYEAGRVHLGMYAPLEWYSISQQLKPGFAVSSADALKADVLPVTSTDGTLLQDLRSFNFALDLAGSAVSKSSTRTTDAATDALGGTVTTATGQAVRTETLTPGSMSLDTAAAGAPSGQVPGTGIDVASVLGLGVDPFLRVRAQAALWQEIQLLNRYLDAEVAGTGETPYLFRAQLSVQPFGHDIPYDVYSEVFVEPVRDEKSRTERIEPRIIPLVIIDNSQGSAERRLANAAQQLETTVSALVASKGIGVGRNQLKQQLRDLQAVGIDSAVMIGQSQDAQLTVRIGAPKSPGGSYEMVPRTYEVTFLVLWPSNGGDKVVVKQYATMRHAKTGKRIEAFPRQGIDKEASRLVALVENQLTPDCIKVMKHNLTDNKSIKDGVPSQCDVGGKKIDWHSRSAEARRVVEFLGRFGIAYDADLFQQFRDFFDARYPSTIEVRLPAVDVRFPPGQTAVLKDTGSGAASVSLAGSSGLNPKADKLEAQLYFKGKVPVAGGPASPDITLSAGKISVDSDGVVTMAYASPSAIGAMDKDAYDSPRLVLKSSGTRLGGKVSTYGVAVDKVAAPKQERLFDMRILPATAMITEAGTATVRVVFTRKPCNPTLTCPAITDFYLSVGEQPIASVLQSGSPPAAGVFEVAKNGILVVPDTPYDVSFAAPVPDSTATFKLVARDSKKKPVSDEQQQDAKVTFKAKPAKPA